jgi:hypothetical protein
MRGEKSDRINCFSRRNFLLQASLFTFQKEPLYGIMRRDMTRHFKLEPGNEVDTYFEDGKLIFDLATADKPPSWKKEAEAQEQETTPAV